MDAPVVVPATVVGPIGKNQAPPQRSAPPTVSVKQQQPRPRANQGKQTGPLPPSCGAGVGPVNVPKADTAAADTVRALQLLQSVMFVKDFSKYEKLLAPSKMEEKKKLREEALLEKVRSQERLQNQELGHCEQTSKLEHNLEQQRAMLQEVCTRLLVVRDEVSALRALVADPTEPTGPVPDPPSLPPPRTPPLLTPSPPHTHHHHH